MSMVLGQLLLLLFLADVRGCVCDPAQPQTMAGKECSLTKAAVEAQPGETWRHPARRDDTQATSFRRTA